MELILSKCAKTCAKKPKLFGLFKAVFWLKTTNFQQKIETKLAHEPILL